MRRWTSSKKRRQGERQSSPLSRHVHTHARAHRSPTLRGAKTHINGNIPKEGEKCASKVVQVLVGHREATRECAASHEHYGCVLLHRCCCGRGRREQDAALRDREGEEG